MWILPTWSQPFSWQFSMPLLPQILAISFSTIAAFIAGIVFVILLLTLNLIVVVGTLNGLIFYANIVAINRSILLPFSKSNFVTIFIL